MINVMGNGFASSENFENNRLENFKNRLKNFEESISSLKTLVLNSNSKLSSFKKLDLRGKLGYIMTGAENKLSEIADWIARTEKSNLNFRKEILDTEENLGDTSDLEASLGSGEELISANEDLFFAYMSACEDNLLRLTEALKSDVFYLGNKIHVLVTEKAMNALTNVGGKVENDHLMLPLDSNGPYDLYNDGENESINIIPFGVGVDGMKLVVHEKSGKKICYEINGGVLDQSSRIVE